MFKFDYKTFLNSLSRTKKRVIFAASSFLIVAILIVISVSEYDYARQLVLLKRDGKPIEATVVENMCNDHHRAAYSFVVDRTPYRVVSSACEKRCDLSMPLPQSNTETIRYLPSDPNLVECLSKEKSGGPVFLHWLWLGILWYVTLGFLWFLYKRIGITREN